jgi:hypothetical protein
MSELLTRKQLATRFGVCLKTMERRLFQLEEEGRIKPQILPGGQGCIRYGYKAGEVLPLLEKMEAEKGWLRGSNVWKSTNSKQWQPPAE